MAEKRKLTPEEEKEVVRQHMIKIGHSYDKKHMSEIGRKGRATLVRNIIARAEQERAGGKERPKQEA